MEMDEKVKTLNRKVEALNKNDLVRINYQIAGHGNMTKYGIIDRIEPIGVPEISAYTIFFKGLLTPFETIKCHFTVIDDIKLVSLSDLVNFANSAQGLIRVIKERLPQEI